MCRFGQDGNIAAATTPMGPHVGKAAHVLPDVLHIQLGRIWRSAQAISFMIDTTDAACCCQLVTISAHCTS